MEDHYKNDFLYKADMPEYIEEFCLKIKNKDFSIAEISDYIEYFKRSTILQILLCDPKDKAAVSLLRDYLQTRQPGICKSFLNYLLTISSIKIKLNPSRLLTNSTNSYTATVKMNNFNNVIPITEMSACTLTETLRNEIKYKAEPYASFSGYNLQRCIGNTVKIKFTEDFKNKLINSQAELKDTIIEGNRRHNMKMIPYIKNKSTNFSTNSIL